MKKLFAVRNGKLIEYFDNKQKAKQYRDTIPGSKVEVGPDHHRYTKRN